MPLRLDFDPPGGSVDDVRDESATGAPRPELVHDLRDGLSLIVDAAQRSLGAPDGAIGWRDSAQRIERQARALADLVDELARRPRPAGADAPRVHPSVFRSGRPDADRCLVLVVDDAPDLCEVYAHALGDRYDVAVAGTAADALRMALRLEPALVLAETELPDRSGEALLADLRAHPALDGVPVVLVPVVGTVEERTRLLKLGAEDVMAKPVGPAEVRDRVDALLTPRWPVRRSAPAVDGDRVWSDRALRREVDERLLRAAADRAAAGLVLARVGVTAGTSGTGAADAADEVLAELLGRMRAELGPRDLLARVEGRQLIAVLVRPSRTEALDAAEALAAAVREELPDVDAAATVVRPGSTTARQALRRVGAALFAAARGHRAGERALRPALAAAARATVP